MGLARGFFVFWKSAVFCVFLGQGEKGAAQPSLSVIASMTEIQTRVTAVQTENYKRVSGEWCGDRGISSQPVPQGGGRGHGAGSSPQRPKRCPPIKTVVPCTGSGGFKLAAGLEPRHASVWGPRCATSPGEDNEKIRGKWEAKMGWALRKSTFGSPGCWQSATLAHTFAR